MKKYKQHQHSITLSPDLEEFLKRQPVSLSKITKKALRELMEQMEGDAKNAVEKP
jgi:hypothetical protein